VNILRLGLLRHAKGICFCSPYKNLLQKLWTLGIQSDLWHLYTKQTELNVYTLINQYQRGFQFCQEYPQRSILCPLLFIVYINDLTQSFMNVLPFLFADNLKCLHSSKSPQDQIAIQKDLNIAGHWSLTPNMTFNCVKNAVLHFWFTHSTVYTLNKILNELSNSVKDLGGDDHDRPFLDWTSQGNNIRRIPFKLTIFQ